MDLTNLTIKQTADGLQAKEFSAVEVTQSYLERIRKLNSSLNAYLTVAEESALLQAKAADARREAGEVAPLLGVPLAIKDNMTTVGIRTTAASKMLENYQPAYDATAVARLKKVGAIILGKTNLDEWAHGASTENSAFGPTKNPWDLSRVPGGSSGGSAAAVAADLCAGALGSDTGGSIRCPASFCGIVGLKTSYGRVSRSGLLAMTSSTDVIGPMTKNVEDAALILDVIAGPDSLDNTTSPYPVGVNDYLEEISQAQDLKNVKVGVVKEWMDHEGLTSAVKEVIKNSLQKLTDLGAVLVDISLPHARYGIPVYYVITPSEVSSNLSRYDGIRYGHRTNSASNLFEVYSKSRGEGLGPEAKRRIMIGTYALSHGYYDAYYKKAQQVRTLMVAELDQTLKAVDVIVGPVSPHVAFKLGEQVDDPLKMYLEDVYMGTASLAGLPSLSLPAGFSKPEGGATNLPIGLQMIGRRFGEGRLLNIAHLLEQSLGLNSKPQLN